MLSCLGDKFLHSATAFRSVEAYNQMISGFIASVQGHINADKFVVLARNPVVSYSRRFVLNQFVLNQGRVALNQVKSSVEIDIRVE